MATFTAETELKAETSMHLEGDTAFVHVMVSCGELRHMTPARTTLTAAEKTTIDAIKARALASLETSLKKPVVPAVK